MKRAFHLWICVMLMLGASMVQASQLPASVQAALIIKLIGFEKKISAAGEVTIFVMGSPEVAAELEKKIGRKIGKSKLANVVAASGAPPDGAHAIYIAGQAQLQEGIGFARSKKILSITGDSSLIDQGVTLGLGVEGGKPKFILNLSASKDEGLEWRPAILKIASTI
jgi:hypothetical protein